MSVFSSDVSERFPKDQLNSRQCIHNLEESVVGTESTSNTRDTLLINKEHASVNIHSEVSKTTTTSELSAKNTQVNSSAEQVMNSPVATTKCLHGTSCTCNCNLKTTQLGEFIAKTSFVTFEGFTNFFTQTSFCVFCRSACATHKEHTCSKASVEDNPLQMSMFCFGQYFWNQHPSLSSFFSPFPTSSFRELWERVSSSWSASELGTSDESIASNLFTAFLIDVDYQFVFQADFMISAWEKRKQKKRAKVPAREVFYDSLIDFQPRTLKPGVWFSAQTPAVIHKFIQQTWLGKHFSQSSEIYFLIFFVKFLLIKAFIFL